MARRAVTRRHHLRLDWVTGALLLLGCAVRPPAAAPDLPPQEPISPPTLAPPIADQAELALDPQVRMGRLENGLTFYIRGNAKPEQRAELWLAINAGSMQEDEDQRGLAHFVEHMAFNGTAHFAKQDLVQYLESIGMRFGPDINAFTSFDETVYTLRVPTDQPRALKRAFQILEDWAGAVSFEDEEIDQERGVMVEEWRLGRGAEARIRDQQFPVLFRDSRYAERLPIGRQDILETAPYEALRRYYRDWYRPDLMAVIAVGDFDPVVIEQLIREHFADLTGPTEARARRLYPVPPHQETLYAITTDPEATIATAAVFYKLARRPRSRVADYRRALAEQLYHQMINARLDELRQRPDPPFLFAFSTSAGFVRTRDVYLQAAGVPEGGASRALKAVLTEAKRVDRHGFTQTELERAKRQLLRVYEQAFVERDKRESESLAGEYLRHFLEEEPSPGIERELQLVQELLPGISLSELNQLANEWISDADRVVLVSGPERPDLQLLTQKDLADVFRRVEASEIEAYVDRFRDIPLVERAPVSAEIMEVTQISEIGVTEWQLANGVRVVLKPTDFKNDQVLIAGFSPGGHSLVPDPDFASASFATAVLGEGGLGNFDQVELEKALAGKLASLSPYIAELEEGVEGSASRQDLETLFQLLYLTFTAPRADPEAFQSFMTRMRTLLENRLSRPEAVFSDEITRARFAGHPRRLPPSLEQLDEVRLDTAEAVFRDRFADATDFTFILVGNFALASIRPLVTVYLGGLPADGRRETWRDVGADPREGRHELEVHKGLEPKSQVRLMWTGPAEWSREHLHDIRSLAEALRIRLRDSLREDLGAVYGVGVSATITPRPTQRYGFSVSFGCAPERVKELIATIRAELDSVRAAGVAPSILDRVQQMQRRNRETEIKRNGFWLQMLQNYYRLDLDPRLILDHEALVARVTSENLQEAARRYLDPQEFFQAVLYPEAWRDARP